MKNAFVFGDVHGDASRLELLISKARTLCPDVPLFTVGDLIDRGPASREVLDICVREKVMGVLGNHELWLHQQANLGIFQEYALSAIMGGKATLKSYGVDSTGLDSDGIGERLSCVLPKAHKDFILGLPVHRSWGQNLSAHSCRLETLWELC